MSDTPADGAPPNKYAVMNGESKARPPPTLASTPALGTSQQPRPLTHRGSAAWRMRRRLKHVISHAPSARDLPSQLTDEYVHRIFNSRTRERNTDNSISHFLQRFDDNCQHNKVRLPHELYLAIDAQKRTTLRFGRLDLGDVPAAALGSDVMHALGATLSEIPVVRQLVLGLHQHLTTNKMASLFLGVMEEQIKRWTTMIPPIAQRRRLRAKIGIENRQRSRSLLATSQATTVVRNDRDEDGTVGTHEKTEGENEGPPATAVATEEKPAAGGLDVSDPYLEGVVNRPNADGLPVFFLQEVKFADAGVQPSMFTARKRHRNSIVEPTFSRASSRPKIQSRRRTLGSHLAGAQSLLNGARMQLNNSLNNYQAAQKIGISKAMSDMLSEASQQMVVANSELEARRLFVDFDHNKDGILEAHEVHAALRDLGLSVSPSESARLLAYLDGNEDGTVSEEEFIHVVAYRMRAAVVHEHVATKVASLTPGQHCVLHPLSLYMQTWDLMMVFVLIMLSFLTPFEVSFVEANITPPYNFWFTFNRIIDVLFAKDLLMHFVLMYPKHSDSDSSQWTITWERNHYKIAMNYLRGWFIIDLLSCIPFDVVAVALVESPGTSVSPAVIQNLRLIRILRLLRIAKLMKILQGGRQFKRFERWLSLRHTVAETVRVVVIMFFCAHWTACAWSRSQPRFFVCIGARVFVSYISCHLILLIRSACTYRQHALQPPPSADCCNGARRPRRGSLGNVGFARRF